MITSVKDLSLVSETNRKVNAPVGKPYDLINVTLSDEKR